jgi:integrase
MRVKDVKDEGIVLCIIIPNTKTKIMREFVVTSGGIEGINLVEIVRKYMTLRPHNTDHQRFFVGYKNGKCTRLPVGINTIGSMPRNIASFLKLPNVKGYSGHSFRRSSTSMLANSGADLLTVKRHGGWKSNTVAEGYIETSIENKKRIATQILGEKNVELEASTSSYSKNLKVCTTSTELLSSSGISFSKCKNVVVNIYKK